MGTGWRDENAFKLKFASVQRFKDKLNAYSEQLRRRPVAIF